MLCLEEKHSSFRNHFNLRSHVNLLFSIFTINIWNSQVSISHTNCTNDSGKGRPHITQTLILTTNDFHRVLGVGGCLSVII